MKIIVFIIFIPYTVHCTLITFDLERSWIDVNIFDHIIRVRCTVATVYTQRDSRQRTLQIFVKTIIFTNDSKDSSQRKSTTYVFNVQSSEVVELENAFVHFFFLCILVENRWKKFFLCKRWNEQRTVPFEYMSIQTISSIVSFIFFFFFKKCFQDLLRPISLLIF